MKKNEKKEGEKNEKSNSKKKTRSSFHKILNKGMKRITLKKKKNQPKQSKNDGSHSSESLTSYERIRDIHQKMKYNFNTKKLDWRNGVKNSFLEKLSKNDRNYLKKIMENSSVLTTPVTHGVDSSVFSKSDAFSISSNSVTGFVGSSITEGLDSVTRKRENSEKKRKTTCKPCMKKIISFLSETSVWRNRDNVEFQRFYPLYHLTTIYNVKKILNSKKLYENTPIEKFEKFAKRLFISNDIFDLFKKEITTDFKKNYALLMELLIQNSTNGWNLVKPKYINFKEKVVKSFCLKHSSLLVREPSLFLKVILMFSYKDLKETLDLFEIFIPYCDILFILSYFRKGVEKKLRERAFKMLEEYKNEFDKNIFLLKPLITLLLKGKKEEDLENYLLSLSSKNIKLRSTIIWEVIVQSKFFELGHYYVNKFRSNSDFDEILTKQIKLNEFVSEIQKKLEKSKEKRKKKIIILRKELDSKKDELFVGEFFLPFNNSIKTICGVEKEECCVYKSNKSPIRLCFKTTNEEQYGVLFKKGDDLRQDQFVTLMISFFDYILRESNIDLEIKETVFQILPTSTKTGFLELVPNSFNFTEILQNFKSLKEFLKVFNESKEKYEVAVEKFTKSLAGYSLSTFLLGVGDRHYENLMLTTNGKFFHVDFSFIFGKDPKLNSPPMRITPEMIEILGGFDSDNFYKLSFLLCSAYQQLRLHSKIIINLLYFMTETKVTQISKENIQKMIERLKINLTDKESNVFLLTKLFKSITSLTPKINDFIHKVAQSLRE